jgi:hypothetical protein
MEKPFRTHIRVTTVIAMGLTVLFPTLSFIHWETTLSSTVVLGVIVTVFLFAFILIGNNDHFRYRKLMLMEYPHQTSL